MEQSNNVENVDKVKIEEKFLFDYPDQKIVRTKFGSAMRKGNYRKNQEDRVSFPNLTFQYVVHDGFENQAQNAIFGIFDGHSGDKASEHCKRTLSHKMEQKFA